MKKRNDIYDIYRALYHFGVSADEVDSIAQNYKTWLGVRISTELGFAYVINGQLCSLPIVPDDKTKKLFVGLELNGVFYLVLTIKAKQVDIDKALSKIKSDCNLPPQLCPELPTFQEMHIFYNYVYESGLPDDDTFSFSDEDCTWIIPKTEYPKRTISFPVDGSIEVFEPTKDQVAYVHPVVHKDPNTFIGRLNYFGVPDEMTYAKYQNLCDEIKKL